MYFDLVEVAMSLYGGAGFTEQGAGTHVGHDVQFGWADSHRR
jgi:hypothetical protein